ncbi:MAG: LacI family DNA-binding transcriptional regulator [Rhodospirillales bacterium]
MSEERADDEAGGSPLSRRITIREIAREAKVSTATVSRALNNPEKVAEATLQAVMAVIDRHHFVMDGVAMSLASRRTRTIGLIIPTITNSIYASSTQAIQQFAQTAGYSVLVGISEFDALQEAALIRRLLERRVDGLILTGATRRPDLYETLLRNRLPFIVTWQPSGLPERPSVAFDNFAAADLAMQHLIGLGHRRIGLICGRGEANDRALARRRAYEAAMRGLGVPESEWLIFERDFEFIEGRTAMHRMLDHRLRPTAVFCANDIQAIGALSECQARGLRVPEEMSLVGFDDLPISQYLYPQLTSIRVPASQMGHAAAEKLIAWIASGLPPESELLPVTLVQRDTSGPAPSH